MSTTLLSAFYDIDFLCKVGKSAFSRAGRWSAAAAVCRATLRATGAARRGGRPVPGRVLRAGHGLTAGRGQRLTQGCEPRNAAPWSPGGRVRGGLVLQPRESRAPLHSCPRVALP